MKILHVICALTLAFSTVESLPNKELSSILKLDTYDVLKRMNQNIYKSNCKTECCEQFNEYIEKIFEKDWATIMFDASSKVQAGILTGNLYELGSFDECISISQDTVVGPLKGKYCMGKIKLPDLLFPENWKKPELSRNFKFGQPNIASRELMLPADDMSLKLKFAFCIPATCPALELNKMVDDVLRYWDLTADFVECECRENTTQEINGVDIVAIFILSVIGLFVILSTIYDLYLNHIHSQTKHPILICFSLYTNGYHLFKVTPLKQNSGTLNSLIGIRFLSMAWIVYAHCYFISAAFPVFNFMESDKFVRSFSGQMVVGSSITVDTFLVMSGLLVSYTILRQFKNGIKLKDIPFIYIHRYIRITPPYAIMILLQVSLVKFFGSGPLWDTTFNAMASGCEKYWWSSLLYVQNYVNPDEVCLGQSWYLSVDMQLFWIAPLLMMFIRKFNRFTYIIIGALTVILVITTFIIAYENSLLAGLIAGTQHMGMLRREMMYVPTHARAAPWMIGLAMGYFLHANRGKRIVMHPVVIATCWTACILTMFAVIFGMYPLMQKGHEQDLGDPAYLALSRPAWSAAVAWLILACENGYGGPINWLLSLSFFQPFARLSYCEYLVHFVLQASIGGVARAPIYFTNFQMFYKMLSDLSCFKLIITKLM